MSENDHPEDRELPENEWEQMLRAVMGDEAAEQVIERMRATGIDPAKSLEQLGGLDLSAAINQVRMMLGTAGDGPVNWKLGEQIAREQIQREHYDVVTAVEADKAREALSAASLWLDPLVSINPSSGPNQVWSRLDWLAHSLPTFKRLTEPVAVNLTRAFTSVFAEQMEEMPDEVASMLGGQDPNQLMGAMTSSLMGVQFGRALAELATICFGTSDAGMPLVEGHTSALVPANVAEFAKDLDAPAEEVLLYVAIREQAASRLFSTIPWLRARVIDSVAAYAREIAIDMETIERQVRDAGMDMEKLQDFDFGSVFATEPSEGQKAALAQLQHLLSLIEGWVSAVSLQVAAMQIPHAVALSEMFNRRASTGSPAQRVFGPLIGLEIQPRRNREAQRFWELAYAKLGIDGRDRLWTHPDLLPTLEAIEKPEAFLSGEATPSAVEEELDAFLAQLLDEADSEASQDSTDAGAREGSTLGGEARDDGDAAGTDGAGETGGSEQRDPGEA